jgi:hypothetical protein
MLKVSYSAYLSSLAVTKMLCIFECAKLTLHMPLLVENFNFQPQKLEKLLLAYFAGNAINGNDGGFFNILQF